MAEKDMTEKTLEAFNDVFADIINGLLFNGEQVLQQESLIDAQTFCVYKADGKLHHQDRDVAKYWVDQYGERITVRLSFLGIENQSNYDPDMPLRVIGYDGAVYRAELSQKERYPVVTLVLYFGYERRWNKPLNLKECFSIPEELEPFVNDYHVNLFEIAWLPDETIAMFQSDFRFVADYFSQKRKNQQYKSPAGEMKHVRAVLELLSAVMQDTRFMDAYNKRIEEGRAVNMDAWIDEAENRGRQESLIENIRNLMKTMKLTKDEAMAALLVPPEKQKELQPLI